jgi:N-acetylglucosaminyldiphosphoundecaprenol N-acetyl-beta-D-mannosaminyltransferase
LLRHVRIGGVKVATASRAELTKAMVADCLARSAAGHPARPLLVFDANGQGISLAARDDAYRAALDRADLIHADGGFIVTVSRWLAGARIAERSATTDLFHDFAAAAEVSGLSFYLLGGTEEVNARCTRRLRELYPRLRLAGRRDGYFDPEQTNAVIEAINDTAPDLLWIGLGKPREQLFAADNAGRFRAGWAITCGGCFDYVAGNYRRAPRWMQRLNLEWLFRALTERRLFWRYLVTSPHALWLTMTRADRRIDDGA